MHNNIKHISVKTKVNDTIQEHISLPEHPFFILMISGGCDSTSLAYIMVERYGADNCCLCHINHMLRKEADQDQQFVENLSRHLNTECFCKKFDVAKYANQSKQNIEQAAREIRYSYANNIIQHVAQIKKINVDDIFLVTAHTQNDRAENFYMRSVVGTGPGGLSAIAYQNNNLIRPLLDISRDELENFVTSIPNAFTEPNGERWKCDKTNSDTTRFRAFIRHEIIPLLKQRNPEILNNLSRTMNLIAQEDLFMNNLARAASEKYFDFSQDSFVINTALKEEPEVIQKRAIYNAFRKIFPQDARINNRSIEAVTNALNTIDYKDNIQNDYAVHSTKRQVFVEPMQDWQRKRNRK